MLPLDNVANMRILLPSRPVAFVHGDTIWSHWHNAASVNFNYLILVDDAIKRMPRPRNTDDFKSLIWVFKQAVGMDTVISTAAFCVDGKSTLLISVSPAILP